MKQFLINEQQAQSLLNILAEFPAKHVLSSIDMLRMLPELQSKLGIVPEGCCDASQNDAINVYVDNQHKCCSRVE